LKKATYSRPKGKQFEDRLYEVLQRGRRARIFPMTAIRDDGAIKDETQWWEDGDEWLAAIRSEAGKVRLDRQEGQPKRLILYCEAAGMVPQLARVADEYGIPVMSGGGFDSLTEKHRLAESNDDTEVLHIGDFDPSGIHVFVSLAEDVSAFAKHYGRTIDFTRLAVTPDQIEELSLNTSPLKRTDHSHMLAFSGDVTCQAEAIPPDELARIVREASRNGAARHRVVARLFVLGEGNPALGLDRVQSERTVGCRAGQNHADSASSSSTAKNTSHGPNCEPVLDVLDVLSVMYITKLVGS
jgi:hypothetical protein